MQHVCMRQSLTGAMFADSCWTAARMGSVLVAVLRCRALKSCHPRREVGHWQVNFYTEENVCGVHE